MSLSANWTQMYWVNESDFKKITDKEYYNTGKIDLPNKRYKFIINLKDGKGLWHEHKINLKMYTCSSLTSTS